MFAGVLNPGFEPLCKVQANLSDIKKSLKQQQGVDGPFYQLTADVVIQPGGTELHAHMEWTEDVS